MKSMRGYGDTYQEGTERGLLTWRSSIRNSTEEAFGQIWRGISMAQSLPEQDTYERRNECSLDSFSGGGEERTRRLCSGSV